MEGDTNYRLILQFDDDSPSFTYGFQAGQIWERMKSGEDFTDMFCGDILDLVQRMASRTDYRFEITEAAEGWYVFNAIAPA